MDVDSIAVCSTSLENVLHALSLCETTPVEIQSRFNRLSNVKSSRFAAESTVNFRTLLPNGKKIYGKVPFNRFPNINLFKVRVGNGLIFTVGLFLLNENGIRCTNYFTDDEIRCLVSAMNAAKHHPTSFAALCKILTMRADRESYKAMVGQLPFIDNNTRVVGGKKQSSFSLTEFPVKYAKVFYHSFWEAMIDMQNDEENWLFPYHDEYLSKEPEAGGPAPGVYTINAVNIVQKGVFEARCAGCKNLTMAKPGGTFDLADHSTIADFLLKGTSTLQTSVCGILNSAESPMPFFESIIEVDIALVYTPLEMGTNFVINSEAGCLLMTELLNCKRNVNEQVDTLGEQEESTENPDNQDEHATTENSTNSSNSHPTRRNNQLPPVEEVFLETPEYIFNAWARDVIIKATDEGESPDLDHIKPTPGLPVGTYGTDGNESLYLVNEGMSPPIFIGSWTESGYSDSDENLDVVPRPVPGRVDLDLDPTPDDNRNDAALQDTVDADADASENPQDQHNEDDDEPVDGGMNLEASIDILQETMTKRALVYPQYLLGRNGKNSIGNVHKDHVLIEVQPDEMFPVMHQPDHECIRTAIFHRHPEKCIEGVNCYMPHTRNEWNKKEDPLFFSEISLFPEKVKAYLSPHLPDLDNRDQTLNEIRNLMARTTRVLESIMLCHATRDKLTVRQELTFASADIHHVQLQWPLPSLNPGLICGHVNTAHAVDMYHYVSAILIDSFTPLRHVFLRTPTDVMNPTFIGPAAKTALVFSAERLALMVDSLGFKGRIHEFWSHEVQEPVEVPQQYVVAIPHSDHCLTQLRFGIDPACMPSIHMNPLTARVHKSNLLYGRILSSIATKVFLPRPYLETHNQIISIFQAYSELGEDAIYRSGEVGVFGFFIPIKFENIATMTRNAAKAMISEIADCLLKLYHQLWLSKLNTKLKRNSLSLLTQLPKGSQAVNSLPQDKWDVIFMASRSQYSRKIGLAAQECDQIICPGKYYHLTCLNQEGAYSPLPPSCNHKKRFLVKYACEVVI
jgi:hypothetical protein